MTKLNPDQVSGAFDIAGRATGFMPYGTGHINDTFLVTFDTGKRYIFQRVNTVVFRDPETLMRNFVAVTNHIGAKIAAEQRNHPGTRRRSLKPARAYDGEPFVRDEAGGFWRCYEFIDGARTFDIVENPGQAFAAAAAFGGFQHDLSDLRTRLAETIPDFHNTPARLAALETAVRQDVAGRVRNVGSELDFVMARRELCGRLIRLQQAGELIERTTHNDTKINNVLIDDVSGTGVCVIDLDTVMPGLPRYDFGDMVRSATNPMPEDTRDLDRVEMRSDIFEALLRGYLSTAGRFLNSVEKSLLPFSGVLITLEIGIRFLTDYVSGDVYFKTSRPEHNLDRARVQFKLAASIERHLGEMEKLNESIGG